MLKKTIFMSMILAPPPFASDIKLPSYPLLLVFFFLYFWGSLCLHIIAKGGGGVGGRGAIPRWQNSVVLVSPLLPFKGTSSQDNHIFNSHKLPLIVHITYFRGQMVSIAQRKILTCSLQKYFKHKNFTKRPT
jgi:hypothetical protein